jgi:hypothetical protein
MSAINGRLAALALADDGRDSLGGCRFLDEANNACGQPRRAGSSYCGRHHALCYLPIGSQAEQRRLRLMGRIADAVGGKTGSSLSAHFIARLERLH